VVRDNETIKTPFLIDGQGAISRTLEGEVQLTWNYAKNNNIILGANFSHDRILDDPRPSEIKLSPFRVVEFRNFNDDENSWLLDGDNNDTRTTLGYYGQIDYDPSPYFSLSAGARLDIYSGTELLDQDYTEFNPRAGIVYKAPGAGNFKLLYGKATRVPNGFEALSGVTILGTPANRPERIQTLQAAWLRNWNRDLRTEFGGFYSVISNHLITDANISESLKARGYIGQFVNLGAAVKVKSQGFDGKMTLRLNKVDAALNLTQIVSTDDGFDSAIAYIPKTMLNANLNVPADWLNVNLGANYRGNFTQPANDTREPVKAYVLVNVTMLAQPKTSPLEFRLGVRNLFDTKVHAPSSSKDFTQHFPGRGLEVWGGATYQFK